MTRKLMCIVPATLDGLRAKGVESHILQRDLGGYWDEVVTLHPFARRNATERLNSRHVVIELEWNGLKSLPRLLHNTIRRTQNNITAIKAHDPYTCGLPAYIAAKCTRIPYAVGIYSSYDLMEKQAEKPTLWFKWLDQTIGGQVLSQADLVLPGNVDLQKWALRHGAREDRTFPIRTIGVETRHFGPLSTRKDVRAEYDLKGKKVALFVGRLNKLKFPGDIIEAFRLLRAAVPESALVMAGDGEMLPRLQEQARGLDVRFLGFVPQDKLMDLMYSVDVILSGLSGSSLVESALSETPIVAYDFDWQGELIEHDVTGLLVPFRDWKAMGEAAAWIIANPVPAKAMGVRAREKAIGQHGLERIYAEETACWERVLGHG